MKIQRDIRLLDIFTACTNLLFVIPVLLPYYRDQFGIGFREFLIGEMAFAAVIVLLDVPSSYISDIWQRKHVLALGAFFEIIGWSILLTGDSFAEAVLAQTVIGVGISLIAGANTAMLYDLLLSSGQTKHFRKYEGRRQAIALYTITAASVAGGFLYEIHHLLPVILTLPSIVAGMIVACMMKEPSRHRKIAEKHPILDVIETTKYALHGHPEVGMIIIFAAIMFSTTKLVMWTQQPYYMEMHIPESLFGVLTAVGSLLGGLSSQFAHKVDGRVSSYQALGIVWIMAVLICLLASIQVGWTGVALLMIGGTCLYGMAWPRVSEAINSQVGSERRATILSTQNLLRSLMFIPTSYALGKVSDKFGIQGALVAIALWLFIAGALLGMLGLWRRRKKKAAMGK